MVQLRIRKTYLSFHFLDFLQSRKNSTDFLSQGREVLLYSNENFCFPFDTNRIQVQETFQVKRLFWSSG